MKNFMILHVLLNVISVVIDLTENVWLMSIKKLTLETVCINAKYVINILHPTDRETSIKEFIMKQSECLCCGQDVKSKQELNWHVKLKYSILQSEMK